MAFIVLAAWSALSAVLMVIESFNPAFANSGLWPFRHVGLIAVVGLGCASVELVGGIWFLKQRRWARTLLEGISWLLLAEVLVSFAVIMRGAPSPWTIVPPAIMAVAFSGGIGLFIKTLRSARIREAMD